MCIGLWHCVFQEDKYALPKDALSRCSSACQLQYRLQQQQGHPVYEVKYIGLGAGMACIAATSDGSRVTTLNVSLQQHLQQQLMHIGMMCMPRCVSSNNFLDLCLCSQCIDLLMSVVVSTVKFAVLQDINPLL